MPVQQDDEFQNTAGSTQASKVVQALLKRHGVDRRSYSLTVAKLLGLSRSAAHNRVHGDAAWPWDDVERLGEYFGESLLDLARGVSGEEQAADLLLDQRRIPVRVRLGVGEPTPSDTWAAFQNPNGLVVAPLDRLGLGVEPLKVLELIHTQHGNPAMRVAVLDDQVDTADSIAIALKNKGCIVTTYTKSDELIDDLARVPHDAFVIDWLLQEGTAEHVLAAIRKQAKNARILLLTGQIGEGRDAQANAVAEAQQKFQFLLCQKPITANLLMSNLRLGVEARGAAS